jgi:anhydro-N-acetylmuramic acid kinase
MADSRLIAGAMSGTSADGVDVAIVRVTGRGVGTSAKLLHWGHRSYPAQLRGGIAEIRKAGGAKLAELAEIGREISLCYAAAVNEALVAAGVNAGELAAVAAHGQTLFHDPPMTIQWFDPSLVAAEVGTNVVSDFRRADCAAGGQGAPLVPLADYLLFRDAKLNRAMLNIGGIANVTFLAAGGKIEDVIAFDTGPGNCLSDDFCRDRKPPFDVDGKLAGQGKAIEPILREVLSAKYFSDEPPKSTDGPHMLGLFREAMKKVPPGSLNDLLCTACAISAEAIANGLREFLPVFPDEVIASGGGTKNKTLISMLQDSIGVKIKTVDEFGIPSAAKEAIAFALLGAATLDGIPGNLPSATGARRGVVLGSITPKP